MLPRRDGIDVLATLRKRSIQTPVFVLTAKDAVEDRVLGLDRGADDYLIKPFAFPELLARIRALLAPRAHGPDPQAPARGSSRWTWSRAKCPRGAQSLDLTAKEFDILEHLLRHRGRVVSREMLARDVWHVDGAGHAARQRHRRDDRAVAPQDRRSVREEAAAHGPRRWVRAGREARMRIASAERAGAPDALARGRTDAHRLRFFSGHPDVRRGASLRRSWTRNSRRELATIDRVYREEPKELEAFAAEWGPTLFQVIAEPEASAYQTEDGSGRSAARRQWRTGVPCRVLDSRPTAAAIACRKVFWARRIIVAAAIEETVLAATRSGRSLSIHDDGRSRSPPAWRSREAISLPGAFSRRWAPWRTKREQITAESLGERLPVDNPAGRVRTSCNRASTKRLSRASRFVRTAPPLYRGRVARAAHAAHRDAERRRGGAPRHRSSPRRTAT